MENQKQSENKSGQSNWHAERWYRVRNRSRQTIKLTGDNHETVALINGDTARILSGREIQKINQDTLNELEGDGKINIRLLDHDQNKDYIISNSTSKRITIRHNAFKDREFFVPAFGSRSVNGATLLDLDYVTWESQGLIQIESPVEEVKIKREFLENLGSWLKLLPGILMILATGVGLPIAIISFYGAESGLQGESSQFLALGRILQTAFIAIASTLPAFLFYLFGRQQVVKQKDNFYREAMLLDPNVWSNSEARNKYGPLLNSVFDTGNSPFSIMLLIVSTALLVNGWIITLVPFRIPPPDFDLIFFFTPDNSPFTFGFLGAYFFTINMVYRRYVRADLTPKAYAYITMRLLTTIVLVWAVSILPQFSGAGSFLETGLSLVAFTIGIFPESALTLIQDYTNKITAKRRGQNPDLFSLTKLEGMNLYDQARLMEEGIENIENLAHHNLMELIVRTRIPTARLVDMFDQSILYLHLGLENEGDGSAENDESAVNGNPGGMRNLLKGLGIRTATDLINCRNHVNDFKDDPRYSDLVRRLKVIIASLEDDEWLNYITSWRDNSSTRNKPPIDNPYQFYFRATGIDSASSKNTAQPLPSREKRKMAQIETASVQPPTEVIEITPN